MELTRDPQDKKRYVLDGYGEVRVGGWYAAAATINAADGRTWEAKRSSWRQRISITDTTGREPARYEPTGAFKRGGELVVGDTTYGLRPSSSWKQRYALVRDGQELATIASGGWSGTKIEVDVTGQVDALVLLTACWLVRQFAEDSASATAATA